MQSFLCRFKINNHGVEVTVKKECHRAWGGGGVSNINLQEAGSERYDRLEKPEILRLQEVRKRG